ncbi:hypothetical protein DESUT3_03140 [Desulfuromonas versatilis]|uniref:diguanylate cyclase n=1 Tax=Desulfuromonas versatilis TaxID=2802975 RepID=A0ABN6DSU3_9BACT|nr:GGDEF domain-containing protein [Desulfuromonas versatilis]BCR03245.1 hypothetical protein DESUT3_03140 [Desulfuromonas versatilis]
MNERFAAILDALEGWSRAAKLGAVLITMFLLGVVDYLTGSEISFAFFYLIPVSFVAWFIGHRWVVFFSISSSVVWWGANFLAGETFSHPLIPWWNTGTRLGFFIVVGLLLARLRQLLEKEREISRTDFLTGALNRRAFYDLSTRELQRARRYRHPFTLAYIDLDNFKQVNDRFGHREGDQLLKVVAQNLAASLRSTDVVARLGGDEFAVLLTETGVASAEATLPKLREGLLAEMARFGWPVTFSIGVLVCEAPPSSVEEMIRRADDLMYSVKAAGKNAIHYDRVSAQQEARPGISIAQPQGADR